MTTDTDGRTTPTGAPATPAAADPSTAADHCPRCGGGFHCGAADPAPCACSTLQLSAALQAELRQRYTGCLCLRCLQALAGGAAP